LGLGLVVLAAGFLVVAAFFAESFFAVEIFLEAAGFLEEVTFGVEAVAFFACDDFLATDVYFFVFVPLALGARAGAALVREAGVLAFVVFGALALVDLVEGAFALAFVVEAFEALTGALTLDAGFFAGVVFSFAASWLTFGASLTLPEGPFGRTKIFFSLPDVIARLS